MSIGIVLTASCALRLHAGGEVGWGDLTCDKLLEMANIVEDALNGEGSEAGSHGWGLMYEKLTHVYWRKFIRRESLKAAGNGRLEERRTGGIQEFRFEG